MHREPTVRSKERKKNAVSTTQWEKLMNCAQRMLKQNEILMRE